MVEHLDATYGALSHPIRREVLNVLRSGPHRVTDLASRFPVSLAATSKHIQILERAQLIRRHTRGREHLLSLNPEPLADAGSWIESYRSFWEERIDALESHLRDER